MSQVQRIDDGVKQIHRLPPQSHGSAARLQQVTAGIEASIKELDQTLKQATPKRAPNFFQAGSRRVQRQVANMNRNVHALKSVAGLLVRKEQEQRQRELALQRQRELEAQQRRHRQSWGRQQPHGPHGHGSHGSGSHGHGAHGHGSNGSHGSHGSHGHGSPQQPSSGQWSPFSQQPEPSRSSTGHSSHRYTPARPVPSTREQPGATPGQFLQGFFGNFR